MKSAEITHGEMSLVSETCNRQWGLIESIRNIWGIFLTSNWEQIRGHGPPGFVEFGGYSAWPDQEVSHRMAERPSHAD